LLEVTSQAESCMMHIHIYHIQSVKLCNRCNCSHAHISNHPPANFTIHYNTWHTAKEQPDVTSDIPHILSLACNWSINKTCHIFRRYTVAYLTGVLQSQTTDQINNLPPKASNFHNPHRSPLLIDQGQPIHNKTLS